MSAKRGKVWVSESIGKVSTLLLNPTSATHLMILGHGAGAGMEHPFMEQLSIDLAQENIATLRYQFPYMEQGKKRPDVPNVAHKTIEQVVLNATESQRLPVVLAGKSFGGRMASQWMAKTSNSQIKALIFYGFPLHSPAKPGSERGAHLHDVKVPMLFLQGDRDALARLELLTPLLEKIQLAQLEVLPGANHGFSFTKKSGTTKEEGYKLLARKTRQFLKEAL